MKKHGPNDYVDIQRSVPGSHKLARYISATEMVSNKAEPEYFLWTLLGVCLVLTLFDPAGVSRYPALIDIATINALAGLMVLTKGIENSHFLHVMATRLVTHLHSERTLAVVLVITAASLATVVTNDIALFAVVPLTLALSRIVKLPLQRIIAFEALAVNAGSALTPIGNPQNLFLWGISGESFIDFTVKMLPFTGILILVLVVLTVVSFAGEHMDLHASVTQQTVQPRVLLTSLLLFIPFVVAIDLGQPAYGLALVLPIYAVAFPYVLWEVDWKLLLIFVLMFIDLRLIAQQPSVQTLSQQLGLHIPQHLYIAGIGVSQIISNVPAAILLEHYTRDWRLLAYSVNVGGFGFMLGSMANLIALRLGKQPGGWRVFHSFSLPYLLIVAPLIYLWLFGR